MKPNAPIKAFIGLGGNVGDVLANMKSALKMLDAHNDVELLSVSKVYSTPPWGIEDQDWFLNACACLQTSLSPSELLEVCLDTEKAMKRERRERWGPRTLDLDILAYGDETISTENLEIPHPRMTDRQFVLRPLCDLQPDLKVNGKSVQEWLDAVLLLEEPIKLHDASTDLWR